MNRRKKKVGLPIRTLLALLAVALLMGGAIGGTLAWLTSKTGEITNTFTDSDINITLTETKGGDAREFQMIPGHTIEKDPVVTVKAPSEPCYVFVRLTEDLGNWGSVEKNDEGDIYNFTELLDYKTAEGWTKLDNVTLADGEIVWYREITEKTTKDTDYPVILKNTITVSGDYVTKEMMDMIDEADETKPTLKIAAAAVQLYESAGEEFEVDDAWDKVKDIIGKTDTTVTP